MPGHLIAQVSTTDTLPNTRLDPTKPYTGCRICGWTYQSDLDRLPRPTSDTIVRATVQRREASQAHAGLHSQQAHADLNASGMWCTPEALIKLAPVGVVPISDIVKSDGHRQAGLDAPRAPQEDTEG